MYDKTHYNIVISLQLIKINEKKRRYGIYIYTVEYYSVKRKNEILPFVATWMDLEIIILNEVNWKEKGKYMIQLCMWYAAAAKSLPSCSTL